MPSTINQPNTNIYGTVEPGSTIHVSSNTNAQCTPVTFIDSTNWECQLSGLSEGVNVIVAKATSTTGAIRRIDSLITLDTSLIDPILTVSPVYSPNKCSISNNQWARFR